MSRLFTTDEVTGTGSSAAGFLLAEAVDADRDGDDERRVLAWLGLDAEGRTADHWREIRPMTRFRVRRGC